MIIASSVSLTFDSPLVDPQGRLVRNLSYFDLGFTIIFLVEALLKIAAFGFLRNGKDSYLRSWWNVLDFMILITSLIDVTFSG